MKIIEIDDIKYNLVPIEEPRKVCKSKVKVGTYWYFGFTGIINATQHDSNVDNDALNFGNHFPTKEEAEQAALQVHQYLFLLAYKREFDADFVPDWSNDNQGKFTITHSPLGYEYFSSATQQPTTVYFSKMAAHILVDKLNTGEVVLPT